MSFDLVIGQPRATAQLRTMAGRQKLPAALLFTGQEGIGKFFTALQLAKVLNCRRAAAGDACGSCPDCRQIDRQVHPDVRIVRAAKNQIKIDQVRELQTYLSYAPLQGLLKVVVVDDAHLFNLAAANAILKTLEEPPEETLFVLVSHRPRALLPTILSRCLQVAFLPLDEESQLAILRRQDEPAAPEPQLESVVRFSGGSMARCHFFLTADRLEWRQRLLAGLAAVAAGDLEAAFALADELSRDEELPAAAAYLCTTFVRDALLLANGGGKDGLLHADLADLARKVAGEVPAARLSGWLDELNRLQNHLAFNINVRLAWEALFLRLAAA